MLDPLAEKDALLLLPVALIVPRVKVVEGVLVGEDVKAEGGVIVIVLDVVPVFLTLTSTSLPDVTAKLTPDPSTAHVPPCTPDTLQESEILVV